MLCVLILYMSGGTYSLKSRPRHIFSVKKSQKSAEKQTPKKYILMFGFVGDAWPGLWTVALRLVSQPTKYLY